MIARVYLDETTTDKVDAYVKGYNQCIADIKRMNAGKDWKPIEEEKPKENEHVIVFSDGFFVLYARYQNGEFFDITKDSNGEFFETTTVHVTHWQPLPEPPQD